MLGHWYTLLLAPVEAPPAPVQAAALSGPDDDGPPFAAPPFLDDDELLHVALALITSGALECH